MHEGSVGVGGRGPASIASGQILARVSLEGDLTVAAGVELPDGEAVTNVAVNTS